MRLPLPMREVLRGLAGGVSFLVAWLLLDMPWWLASALGVGSYAAASFLLPLGPPPPEAVSVAPGITAQEHQAFVGHCASSAAALHEIAQQIGEGDFRGRVAAVAQTTARLAEYFRQKPESMLAAVSLPLNLDQLLTMLRQYTALSQSQLFPAGTTVGEALRKVEQTVGNAALAFDGMYRQLLDNDVVALQASAASLEYLLGVQPDLERAHLQQRLEALTDLDSLPADPAPRRQRHREESQ